MLRIFCLQLLIVMYFPFIATYVFSVYSYLLLLIICLQLRFATYFLFIITYYVFSVYRYVLLHIFPVYSYVLLCIFCLQLDIVTYYLFMATYSYILQLHCIGADFFYCYVLLQELFIYSSIPLGVQIDETEHICFVFFLCSCM